MAAAVNSSDDRMFFLKKDASDFRQWLALNIEEVTWHGRHLDDFNHFWDKMFRDGISFDQLILRFNIIDKKLTSGPLVSWIIWLKEKLIIFLFLFKNISINELSSITNLPIGSIALLLRNFFLDRLPQQYNIINKIFHLPTFLTPDQDFTYDKLANLLGTNHKLFNPQEEDVLQSVEITLYNEWKTLLQFVEKEFQKESLLIADNHQSAISSNIVKFIKEFCTLLLLASFLIYSLKYLNIVYEQYLIKKVKIFSTEQFDNIKEIFPQGNKKVVAELHSELKQIDEIENQKRILDLDFQQEERFDSESDVMLTSVDSLPTNFQGADFEKSDFEEILKGGYRDEQYGKREVYRVMMEIINSNTTMNNLFSIIKKFKVKKVNTVRPGTRVPGGIYFNLLVPNRYLKDFLTQVTKLQESILYVSKTRRPTPPGKSKVFIWMKEI